MENPFKVVVPISGGKDSQACLKLALQQYRPDQIIGLFCDTKFEHDLTYAHVEQMRRMYGVHIETITAGSVEEQCVKHGRFPGGGARFCTEELKIWPSKRFYKALAELMGSRLGNKKKKITASQIGGFEVWLGVRLEESTDRAKRYAGKVCDEVYAPHEVMRKYPQYLAKLGVTFRLAILDWSEQDVKEFVGVEELNPLYLPPFEFDRVGCYPCLASNDTNKKKAFNQDEFGRQQYGKVIKISAQIGKSVWRSESKGAGCAMCSI